MYFGCVYLFILVFSFVEMWLIAIYCGEIKYYLIPKIDHFDMRYKYYSEFNYELVIPYTFWIQFGISKNEVSKMRHAIASNLRLVGLTVGG